MTIIYIPCHSHTSETFGILVVANMRDASSTPQNAIESIIERQVHPVDRGQSYEVLLRSYYTVESTLGVHLRRIKQRRRA